MFWFFLPLILGVLACVPYHICLKVMPQTVQPLVALAIAYTIAALSCILILTFGFQKIDWMQNIKDMKWLGIALGLAILGVELAFLLAYRAGWNVNAASITFNALVGITMVAVGYLFFREHLTWINVSGIAFCLIGIFFINYGR
ncbi:MAG: EamA family transporter [Verrucomicrobiota bacterium]